MSKFIDEEYCTICKIDETHLNDMDCLAYENEVKEITLSINNKDIKVTVKPFKPRIFTADEFNALTAKAGA